MMGTVRLKSLFIVGFLFALVAFASEGARGEEELDQVSEVQCRPYIEKALKDLETGPHDENGNDQGDDSDSKETKEVVDEQISSQAAESTEEKNEESNETDSSKQTNDNDEDVTSNETTNENVDSKQASEEETQDEKTDEEVNEEIAAKSDEDESNENTEATDTEENVVFNEEDNASSEVKSDETVEIQSNENNTESSDNDEQSVEDAQQSTETDTEETTEDHVEEPADESTENNTKEDDSNEPEEVVSNDENDNSKVEDDASVEEIKSDEKSIEINADDSIEKTNQDDDNKSDDNDDDKDKTIEENGNEESEEKNVESVENEIADDDETSKQKSVESTENDIEISSREKRSLPADDSNQESGENVSNDVQESGEKDENTTNEDEENDESNETTESTPEEELIEEIEIPENLRPRDHINQILRLDMDNEDREAAVERAAGIVLKDLKKLYDTAIQPLETLFKYRDLSNRHFGDPEIFSKPLILFMGPWSGGKSSIINYLLDNEYKPTALRTGGLQDCIGESCKPPNATDAGAEPSPAYFNILMYGEEEEVLDGTQLAADWTFSGLQKFGQGMLDRLRGLKLKHKLLEKVNIVEIPGILEIRKQVQRLFPFNDACQWFIDRADIIFLVYDPSKLDVGPETEAILDQLKGREYQTRIILNKADQVKPEELMRVQGALIWNISPLMSSAEPPIMYSTSLWSLPYETGSPTRLLYAQERAFLRDLRTAIDKRVEHKIASARRFAVRVRNHAKMVDCYLTTYYNHKTFFGSAKETSDKIIENPQEYHIYEGLSTLTNISRYDLPDPDVYRDFFRLNKLYDFSLLSSTCTYFRGCPINRLDVAIAYDLPELVGKYKKSVETAINENNTDGKPPTS